MEQIPYHGQKELADINPQGTAAIDIIWDPSSIDYDMKVRPSHVRCQINAKE